MIELNLTFTSLPALAFPLNIEYVIFLRKEGSPIALKDFLQKADTLYEEEIL